MLHALTFKQLSLICLACLSLATTSAAKEILIQEARASQCHQVTDASSPLPTSQERPRNIILMIGDGMGHAQIDCAITANKGQLHMRRFPVLGMVQTNSANQLITDSAAAGTALACGVKTNNGALGINAAGDAHASLAKIAQERGMVTGIVVTKTVTDATPAAFYAHSKSRQNTAEIAQQLLGAGMSVIIGGGQKDFSPQQQEQLQHNTPLLRFLASGNCAYAPERGDVLRVGTKDALNTLDQLAQEQGASGIFLMIEGSSIDPACHDNNLDATIEETLDFDRAVGEVISWSNQHPETLIVILADHSTGGLVLHGGNIQSGSVKASFSSGGHNGINILSMAAGASAHHFGGYMDNTDIFKKIRDLLPPQETKAAKN